MLGPTGKHCLFLHKPSFRVDFGIAQQWRDAFARTAQTSATFSWIWSIITTEVKNYYYWSCQGGTPIFTFALCKRYVYFKREDVWLIQRVEVQARRKPFSIRNGAPRPPMIWGTQFLPKIVSLVLVNFCSISALFSGGYPDYLVINSTWPNLGGHVPTALGCINICVCFSWGWVYRYVLLYCQLQLFFLGQK